MNRQEFMAQLERLLYDVPEQERIEAINYYNSYFDDAGAENESKVIQELGSPGKVAAIIKSDLEGSGIDFGEYTETGYRDERFGENHQVPEAKASASEHEEDPKKEESSGSRRSGYQGRRQRRTGGWALIIVALVFASPLLFGIGGGILGVIFGIGGGILGGIVAFAGGGIGLIIGGIAAFIAGIVKMFVNPALGLAATGSGALMIAVGILLFLAFLWVVCKLVPWIVRKVIDLCRRILHRGKGGDRV